MSVYKLLGRNQPIIIVTQKYRSVFEIIIKSLTAKLPLLYIYIYWEGGGLEDNLTYHGLRSVYNFIVTCIRKLIVVS